jgi:hypothetical protein
MITLEIKTPLSIGQKLFLHCQSQKTICKINKIHRIFSKKGDVNKLNTL